MFFNSTIAKSFALTIGALLLPAVAQAKDTKQFVDADGVAYTYTSSVENGRKIITGETEGNVPFRLVVQGERVSGEYNGKPVDFSLRESKRNARAVAAR